ncbi:hypothetical protein GE09DRAFT_1219368 [Coniochaeta sp. 2T2.1]|nr:hypothetical protein GE09DRAFT_1219368 [Coniochaeta sp. 2T2.1]
MLLLTSLSHLSLASALSSPLADHDVQEQVWIVPITPGGPTVTLNGTVQQLFSQLTKLNPNYEAEFPPRTPGMLEPRPESGSISKRDDNEDDENGVKYHRVVRIACGHDFYEVPLKAKYDPIVENIVVKYLEKVGGQPTQQPKTCSRVSCAWDVGIWWCNHNDEEFTLDSFKVIAAGARQIFQHLCYAVG